MSRLGSLRFRSNAQTVGATTATIATFDPATISGIANVGFYAEGIAIARNSATGDSADIKIARSIGLTSGTLSVLGSLGTILAPLGSAALLTIAADMDVSASVLRLRVTGIALLTLDWTGHIEIWSGDF